MKLKIKFVILKRNSRDEKNKSTVYLFCIDFVPFQYKGRGHQKTQWLLGNQTGRFAKWRKERL